MAQEQNEATHRWLRKERLLQSLAFVIRRARSGWSKAVDSCWHPARTCVVGWHGDCSAKHESGWSRPSPCRFSGTPEHFQASTYRISSWIFLRLQTAGKSIQWKAIRACLRATAGLQHSSRVVRYALDLSHWGKMLAENRPRMQPDSQERRLMRRFDMRLPALVRLGEDNEFQTETQNVSARGVFFYLDRSIPAGTHCEVTLTFPPHITLTDAVRVRFTARVIRSESPLPSLRVGTAAMIEDYEFLRSTGSTDFISALQKDWKAAN